MIYLKEHVTCHIKVDSFLHLVEYPASKHIIRHYKPVVAGLISLTSLLNTLKCEGVSNTFGAPSIIERTLEMSLPVLLHNHCYGKPSSCWKPPAALPSM